MKRLVATISLLAGVSKAISVLPVPQQDPMPPGIAVQLTMEGPAFVDAKGMTLYKQGAGDGKRVVSCSDRAETVLQQNSMEGKVDFPVTVPDAEMRGTCAQKRPPLLAPAEARPIGKWSIHLREGGARQWAYDGEPLHTSIKDKRPGEINGGGAQFGGHWTLARAPLFGAPPSITSRITAAGLALASPAGKTLYSPDRGEIAVDSKLWRPLKAPAVASADQMLDWSIEIRGDGLRQWAYKGKPLYTYAHDSDIARDGFFNDIFGLTYGQAVPGWRVVLLSKAPSHPAEVGIRTLAVFTRSDAQKTMQRWFYANTKGMTLYTIHCIEDTADRLDCDDVGDSPSYWLSFCGGEERCARTWRPLAAPAAAKPVDNIWSVITINSRHPWKAMDKNAPRLTVWAYRGRPVFTYAHDLKPGDHYGVTTVESDGAAGPKARLLQAFDAP